jgi:hypothetical protein
VSFILGEHRHSPKEGLLVVALDQTQGLTLVREHRAKNALHQNVSLELFTIEEGEEGPTIGLVVEHARSPRQAYRC